MNKYFTQDFKQLSDSRKVEELAAMLLSVYASADVDSSDIMQSVEHILEHRKFLDVVNGR